MGVLVTWSYKCVCVCERERESERKFERESLFVKDRGKEKKFVHRKFTGKM